MISLGKDNGGVTERAGSIAKDESLGLAPNVGNTDLPTPPFLVDYVKQQILDDPNGWYSVLGKTPQERAAGDVRGRAEHRHHARPGLAARRAEGGEPAVGGDPAATPTCSPSPTSRSCRSTTRTGAIRTMLSGRNYQKDQINTVTTAAPARVVVQAVRPGGGVRAGHLADRPVLRRAGADPPGCYNQDGSVWNVTNAEGTSLGFARPVPRHRRLGERGVRAADRGRRARERRRRWRTRLGITTPLPPVCALATGSVGITPLDQASGYADVRERRRPLHAVRRQEIRRGKRVLYEQTPDCTPRDRPRRSPTSSTELLDGSGHLRHRRVGLLERWGPWPIARQDRARPTCNKELWFAGYTRQVTTAVWVGSPQTPYEMPDYWGYPVFGGTIAAPIWKAYMLQVMQGMPAAPVPAGRARAACPSGRRQDDRGRRSRCSQRRVQGRRSEIVDSYLPKGTVAEQEPGRAAPQAVAGHHRPSEDQQRRRRRRDGSRR